MIVRFCDPIRKLACVSEDKYSRITCGLRTCIHHRDSSQSVGHADARIVGREILSISCDQEHRVCLRCCPDNCVGQFDVMVASKIDGTLCNLFIECNDIEAAQKAACRNFDIASSANHHLHPRDDTNGFFGVALKVSARLWNGTEIVDEN